MSVAQASILYLGGLKTLRMETLGVSVRPIAPAGRVDRDSSGHEDRRDRLERVLVFNVFGQALFCRGPPRPFRRQPLQLAVICGHKENTVVVTQWLPRRSQLLLGGRPSHDSE